MLQLIAKSILFAVFVGIQSIRFHNKEVLLIIFPNRDHVLLGREPVGGSAPMHLLLLYFLEVVRCLGLTDRGAEAITVVHCVAVNG